VETSYNKKGAERPESYPSIDIKGSGGDVFGVGSRGSGNIFGKEVGYTVQGNVINLAITGDTSKVVLDNLQKIMTISTQVEQADLTEGTIPSKVDIKNNRKLKESSNTQQQIRNKIENGELKKQL
jgi:hypothetical protein